MSADLLESWRVELSSLRKRSSLAVAVVTTLAALPTVVDQRVVVSAVLPESMVVSLSPRGMEAAERVGLDSVT